MLNLPGTSGTLSPFGNIKGLSFDDSMEPDNFRFEFIKAIREVIKEEHLDSVDLIFDNPDEYYEFVNTIHKFNEDNIKIRCVQREKEYDKVITEEEEDLEETLSFYNTKKDNNKKEEKKEGKKKKK